MRKKIVIHSKEEFVGKIIKRKIKKKKKEENM